MARQLPEKDEAASARQELRRFARSLPESYEEFPWGEVVAKVKLTVKKEE